MSARTDTANGNLANGEETIDVSGNGSNDSGEHPSSSLPRSNTEYGKLGYWEERFTREESFEWLVSYSDVSSQIKGRFLPLVNKDQLEILLVGCGNSSFSSDLYDDGYTRVTSLDYSTTVIDLMKKKNRSLRPEMKWVVMDMTDMSDFPDASFDLVIDKAAMDAIMTDEGDVWNPKSTVVESARSMCRHISRILKPNGYHLHISFAQPHFRKKYLLGLHGTPQESVTKNLTCEKMSENEYSPEFGWDFCSEKIGGEDSTGCFHHFLYIMQKL